MCGRYMPCVGTGYCRDICTYDWIELRSNDGCAGVSGGGGDVQIKKYIEKIYI